MEESNPLRDRDRVARILRREGSGEVAFDSSGMSVIAARLADSDMSPMWRDYLLNGEFKRIMPILETGSRDVFGPYLPDLPEMAELSEWGIGRLAVTTHRGEHAGHQYRHPLAKIETIAELDAYPFPEPGQSAEEMASSVRRWQGEGFTVIGQMSQTILETAYLMRGIEQLMLDFYLRPEFVQALFGKLADRRAEQARRLAIAGVDVLRIGDDIATQEGLIIGPALYREQLQPHHARVIAAARAINPELPVLYHSDGNLTSLLDDLLAIGVTAINPVQPECMDVMAISEEYGDQLTLWGCTSVQSIYAYGSAAEVQAETQHLFERVATRHGVIIQFINLIKTDHAMDNLVAFCEAYRDLYKAQIG